MLALRFDGELKLVRDAPVPRIEGEALVRVTCAGICNTDLEITRGYAGFTGTPGHEFCGVVSDSPDRSLIGKRVVGEINAGCGRCEDCQAGDSRHCPTRTVLGIKSRDGAFAEFLSLPIRNLVELPDTVSDLEAVFVEPLAAACQILDQVRISAGSRVVVLGDGKLAQLIVMALRQTSCQLTMIGKHAWKLDLASELGARTIKLESRAETPLRVATLVPRELGRERFDVVIEASGSPDGLGLGIALARPRGVVVLKSTHHGLATVDSSGIVVNEITLIGSRCGRLSKAIELLSEAVVDVRPLISRCVPLEDWDRAFSAAAGPDVLKVIFQVSAGAFEV